MSGRPNFYLLLKLDPTVDDWPIIEKQIKEMQRKWSKDRSMGNPKEKRHAEASLHRLKEIETVLSNPDTRQDEAREALRQIQHEEKKKRKELDGAVELLKAGGSVTDEQIRRLVVTFAATFSEAEIRKHLKSAGVAFASDPVAGRKPRAVKEQIDKVTASNIRQNLDHLGLKSLYELLQMGHRSSPKALSDKAEEIYKENHRLGRTDADTSAQNALAGFCKAIFQNDEQKARYDNFLVVEAMESLKGNLELAGADNHISIGEIDTLVKQARELGVPGEDARGFIEEYAVSRKWSLQKAKEELPAEALRQCGFCSTLATPGASRCPKCGEALDLECPGCSKRIPSDTSACPGCGAHIGDAPSVSAYLREGQQQVVSGDLSAAIQAFEKCLLYWPGWKPALDARESALRARQSRETEIRALESLVNERKLAAAETELARFERTHGSSGLGTLKKSVAEGLEETRKLFGEGSRLSRQGESEKALELYEKALLSCADFQPAIQAMAKSPPPAPGNLRVQSFGNGFRLVWNPPGAAKSLSYRVLRKARGVPRSEDDGVLVGDMRTSSVDDTDVPAGTPWHYAVFSRRGSAFSVSAAQSGPHLRTAEVSTLEVMAGQGDVSLTWTAPPGAVRVEVWRKNEVPPARRGDGHAVVTSGSSAQDTGLTNGRLYGYRVVAVYPDPISPSDLLFTPGVTASASPVAPPASVADLSASRTGRNVLLTWTASGATVQIRQAETLPAARPGTILPLSQADRIGTLVPNSTRNSAQVTLTRQGRLFFVPLSVAAGTAAVGVPVEVTTIDPVTGLKTLCSGPNIVLTWDWPPGLTEASVVWSHDTYPESQDAASAGKARVTLTQYSQKGCWILPSPERKVHYFSVFPEAPGGLFGPPARCVEAMGSVATVSYEVRLERPFLGKAKSASVALTCDDKGLPVLPHLIVVGKPGLPPISATDGLVLTDSAVVPLAKGQGRIPINSKHLGGNLVVKLFFKNPEDCRVIRLLPAPLARLRVG